MKTTKEKTTEEMISVMQAYIDGKQIQFLDDGGWVDCPLRTEPFWDWGNYDYRVKPEHPQKKVVPYKSAEEFLAAQKEHGPYVNTSVSYIIPKVICCNEVHFDGRICHFGTLTCFLWQDGTPCGKEVEV